MRGCHRKLYRYPIPDKRVHIDVLKKAIHKRTSCAVLRSSKYSRCTERSRVAHEAEMLSLKRSNFSIRDVVAQNCMCVQTYKIIKRVHLCFEELQEIELKVHVNHRFTDAVNRCSLPFRCFNLSNLMAENLMAASLGNMTGWFEGGFCIFCCTTECTLVNYSFAQVLPSISSSPAVHSRSACSKTLLVLPWQCHTYTCCSRPCKSLGSAPRSGQISCQIQHFAPHKHH